MVEPLWETLWLFLNKLNIELPHDPIILLLGNTPPQIEDRCPNKNMCTNVHNTFFTWAKRSKEPKCPSTDERINKMWSSHTMEYYLDIKRIEVLIYVMTWMTLENVPSERNHTQKIRHCMNLFIWNIQNSQIHRHRKQIRGCPAGEGKIRVQGLHLGWWKVLGLDRGDGCTLWRHLMPLNCALQRSKFLCYEYFTTIFKNP